MASKKEGLLPRIEILILMVFFVSFFGWVFNKCNRTKANIIQESTIQEIQDSLDALGIEVPNQTQAAQDSIQTPIESSTPVPIEERPYSILYVTIDGLNMRDQPNLKGEVIASLSLFEEVEFLNEYTDSTTQLKLSEDIYADEPWIRVRNRKGRDGWVYGAGVNYYKKKREGVLDWYGDHIVKQKSSAISKVSPV